MAQDKKKYNYMEPVLNTIQKKYISLPEAEIRTNNEILNSILTKITQKMKENDSLFREMFSHVFYGGSYYDGLKVGKPEEYDLDLLLKLPKMFQYKLIPASNRPGFITVRPLNTQPTLDSIDLEVKYKGFDKFIKRSSDHYYLDNSEVRKWMEGVVFSAMNEFLKNLNNQYVLRTDGYGDFLIKVHKSGPAFTLKAVGFANGNQVNLDIDLVPCILFQQNDWPKDVGYISNPVPQKSTFFIVPKPIKKGPKSATSAPRVPKSTKVFNGRSNMNQYWRLSFQEQERVLIDGKKTLKPSIKLLKKMRDYLGHNAIASYYIKSVALRMAAEKPADFWNNSLSYVFMSLLKEYQTCLQNKSIPYYWNKHFNLLHYLNDNTVLGYSNKIKNIIAEIERNPRSKSCGQIFSVCTRIACC